MTDEENRIKLKQLESKIKKKREHIHWLSYDVKSSEQSQKLQLIRKEEISELEREIYVLQTL